MSDFVKTNEQAKQPIFNQLWDIVECPTVNKKQKNQISNNSAVYFNDNNQKDHSESGQIDQPQFLALESM